MIQWVQGVWFLIILRAFYIKMSRVASRIYALLSVIRQQMSPFDPFRGGGRQKGTMSPFFTVFFTEERPLDGRKGRSKKQSQNPRVVEYPSPRAWVVAPNLHLRLYKSQI